MQGTHGPLLDTRTIHLFRIAALLTGVGEEEGGKCVKCLEGRSSSLSGDFQLPMLDAVRTQHLLDACSSSVTVLPWYVGQVENSITVAELITSMMDKIQVSWENFLRV